MGPIEAGLLVAALMLPFHILLQRQLTRLCAPQGVGRDGVVIRREEILERRTPVLGQYRGRTVHASVVFLGMEYRFDRVVRPTYRDRVRERELFLEPGLVYIKG